MPTLGQMHHVPRTKDWQEFQELTRDCLVVRWNSPNLQVNGRQGQTQNGVDIYGEDDLGRSVGIQCKNSVVTELTLKTVNDEITNATSFQPPISSLFVATAASRDAKLQAEVRKLSEVRVQGKQFAVGVLFWDDLMQELVKDPRVLKKYYPDLKPTAANDARRLLAVFDFAFFGVNLREHLDIYCGIFATDPYDARSIIRAVMDTSAQLFEPGDAARVRSNSELLVALIYDNGPGAPHDLCRKIRDDAQSLFYSLNPLEISAYQLAEYCSSLDNAPSKKVATKVLELVATLGASQDEILEWWELLEPEDGDVELGLSLKLESKGRSLVIERQKK